MELYQRYGPALLRQCERILGNRSDAEDVVQTLFEELLRKRKTDEALPYLYRSCTNRCLNLIRDRKRRAELLRDAVPSAEPPPRILLEERTVGIEMLTALAARLDKKSSEILVYRYLDDMGQEEIAQLMRLSRKSVGKRLTKIAEQARLVAAGAAEGALS